MNLIIGNAAGTFSTVLKYLSWMTIADIPENNISLKFHWANKTDFDGNTFYYYGKVKKDQVGQDFLFRNNLASNFFDSENCNILTNFEEYVECYPNNSQDLIKTYPYFIQKYMGGGCDISQYSDTKVLSEIRKNYNIQWGKLNLTERVKLRIEEESKILKEKKVLTVMIRYSGHYLESNILLNNLIEEVKNKLDEYDNILLLTQVQEVFDIFIQTFGDRCIFPERERISGDIDWKGGRGVCMSDEEYSKEVEECIVDVCLASKTSHIMSGASNMFLGSLSINPEISFSIFDSLKSFNGA